MPVTDEELDRIIAEEARRYVWRTNLSAFVAPDPYAGLAPAQDPEIVARLSALAEERKQFDALLAAQPRLTTAVVNDDLSMYAPPDPYAHDLQARRDEDLRNTRKR